ncbi:hypothetical protein RCL1_008112 [Eukaryota sp. TZLM3-RCL]
MVNVCFSISTESDVSVIGSWCSWDISKAAKLKTNTQGIKCVTVEMQPHVLKYKYLFNGNFEGGFDREVSISHRDAFVDIVDYPLEVNRSSEVSHLSCLDLEASNTKLTEEQLRAAENNHRERLAKANGEIENLKKQLSSISHSYEQKLREKEKSIQELTAKFITKNMQNTNEDELKRQISDREASIERLREDLQRSQKEIHQLRTSNEKIQGQMHKFAQRIQGVVTSYLDGMVSNE